MVTGQTCATHTAELLTDTHGRVGPRPLTALLKLGHFWAMTLLGLFVTAARPTHSKAFIVLFLYPCNSPA